MKKRQIFLIILALTLILSLSFVSAGRFSDIWNKITGQPIGDLNGNGNRDNGGDDTEGWTQWYNRDSPDGTGDYETLVNLRQEYPSEICDSPTHVECQTTAGVDYIEADQVVTCNTEKGFYCRNRENTQRCLDYRVRFYCGEGKPEEPRIENCIGTPIIPSCGMVNKDKCERVNSCALTSILGFTRCSGDLWPCRGQTSRTGCEAIGCGWCVDDDEDGWNTSARCNDGVRFDCNGNNPKINPDATEICTGGVDEDCDGKIDCDDSNCGDYPACVVETENWTQWYNRDSPGGSGDYETLINLREEYPGKICNNPAQVDCQTTRGVDYTETNQTVTCNIEKGFYCRNNDNTERCLDYKVRFFCGEEEPIECTDSDAYLGGLSKQIYEKGNCTDAGGTNYDECISPGSNAIHEQVCNTDNECARSTIGCSSGYLCLGGACVNATINQTYCGDGMVQQPNNFGLMEECDDGNAQDGDGCSANCQLEGVCKGIVTVDCFLLPKQKCGARAGCTWSYSDITGGWSCSKESCSSYKDNVTCESVADCRWEIQQPEEPTKPVNATISVATLKGYYYKGDQINLTDPPEEEPKEEALRLQASLLEEGLFEGEVEIQGYIVQLKEKPVIEKEIELKKQLKELEESSISYSQKAKRGFFLFRPYYKLQSNNKKDDYTNVNRRYATEIESVREGVIEEHEKFLLGSINNVLITGRTVGVNGASILEGKIEREFNYIFNGFVLDISEDEANEIAKLDEVKEVYPNYKVQALLDSSISAMNFDLAKEYTGLDGEGIAIAVIDTGIDARHESLDDLDDNPNTEDPKVIGWQDFINFKAEPYDDAGHGTHVSGIAAGTGGGSDYIGVAPKANLVGVKVLNGGGGGTSSTVIAGIEWVVQHKDEYDISIISMSLGANVNSDGTTPEEIAADYAVAMGINFAVSAGNEGYGGYNTVGIPASAFNVTTVGAVDDDLEIAGFSSRGPTKDGRIKPEVTAVGVNVISSVPGNDYRTKSGTSMSAPHVAGFMALLLQQDSSLTPQQVRNLLMQTAVDKGIAGPDNDYGWGVVDSLETVFSIDTPEHEISLVDLDMNNYLVLNEEAEIIVKVKNYGLNDESVEIKLFVDDIEADSKNVQLLSKETKDVEFSYVEDVAGTYEIKVRVTGVSGEAILENNEGIKEVEAIEVLGEIKAVVVDSWGNHKSEFTIFDELNEGWFNYGNYLVDIDYDTLRKEDITYEEIVATNADVLVISNSWASGNYGMFLEFTDSEIQAIKRYVEEGHGLIGTSGTLSELVTNNMKLAELFGLKDEIGLWSTWEAAGGGALSHKNINILVEDDILTRNLPASYMPFDMAVLNLELDRDTGVVKVAEAEHREDIFVSAYKPDLGASVYFTIFPEYGYSTDEDKQFFYNSIVWTTHNTGELTKDIAIYDLQAPKKSRPGEEISISATINNGPTAESSVDVNLIIEEQVIETRTLNFLAGEKTAQISFSFTPEEIKEHEIIIEAVPLANETYLINNKVKTSLLVPGALLNGDNRESLIDIGDDGKYDYLLVSIGLEVFEYDYYQVSLDLESYLGAELYSSAYAYKELDINDTNISVLMPLHEIKKFELNGPYKIKNIELRKKGRVLDSDEAGFVTQVYNYAEFRNPARTILDSFSDYGFDKDEDSLYDYLVINFSVDVYVAGDYNIRAGLAEGEGEGGGIPPGKYMEEEEEVGSFSFSASEPGIYNASIKFLGREIRKSRLDGPYDLESVEIYSTVMEEYSREESIKNVYTTKRYSYEEFETYTNIHLGWDRTDYLMVEEENEIPVPIYNDGTEDVGSFNVSLFLMDDEEDIFIENITIEGIESGSFEEVVFHYTPTESGWLYFEAIAHIEDENLEDNTLWFSIKSYLDIGADLRIYPEIWDKDYILNEPSEIEFDIYNSGLETAENIVASFYSVRGYYDRELEELVENLTLIDSKRLGNLEVYEGIEDSFDYTPLSKYNSLMLNVSADNEVFPGDNDNYFTLRAKLRGADLEGYVKWTGLNFVVGTENKINFIVNNIGTETAEDIVVGFYKEELVCEETELGGACGFDYVLIEEQEISEVLPKESKELIFTYIPKEDSAGDYEQFLINITAANDVDLENNDYYFSKKIAPQSKIVNYENISISGNLKMILQKSINETWIDEQVVVDKEVTILPNDLIKLDNEWNSQNVFVGEAGNYRVYAALLDSNGNVIPTSDDGLLEVSWDFYVY